MTVRVMWLLNHGSARKFDLSMLRTIGIQEIFTPKLFPQEINFRSANVDFSFDSELTIPKEDLHILNEADWYRCPSERAWAIANEYFDVAFFIAHDIEMVKSIAMNFKGAIVWRAFGLDRTMSYTKIIESRPEKMLPKFLSVLNSRFWMAYAYPHLGESEGSLLNRRGVYLPLGMSDCSIRDQWRGSEKKVYFVCPDIAFNAYYKNVYKNFIEQFGQMDYAIGGSQPATVHDPRVLGFVPADTHQKNMQEFRVIYYHSTEPNHVHYHPFEAIRAGMPLVFIGGGMLDRLGGTSLPGRCATVQEARAKIERILNDDWTLIESIRQSQPILLESMKAENCEPAWRKGFQCILAELAINRADWVQQPVRRKRVAVIVPVGYRGGSLQGAKLLAQAIYQGSREFNEAVEVVFLYPDDAGNCPEAEFSDLFGGIKRRAFNWKKLDPDQARRAMRYAGYEGWEPHDSPYMVLDDGMRQLMDCDLWLVVSDRLSLPLLPLRPSVHMVYDYVQRYVPIVTHGADAPFIDSAIRAERVLVTTQFTQEDAIQYAGLKPGKVFKVPMLAPDFTDSSIDCSSSLESTYFLWTTNAAPHKNHENALRAMKWYYEELDGKLDCRVTGANTANLLKDPPPHLAAAASLLKSSKVLRRRIHWLGELSHRDYQRTLAGASFLLHASKIDNGTFSVIEAASLGVPSLSSEYPAMREIEQQFGLNLAWMDANDPIGMAEQLKQMELTHHARRSVLPSKAQLAEQRVDKLAGEYWKVVRECL